MKPWACLAALACTWLLSLPVGAAPEEGRLDWIVGANATAAVTVSSQTDPVPGGLTTSSSPTASAVAQEPTTAGALQHLSFLGFHLSLARAARLGGPWYLAPGLELEYGRASGARCSTAVVCAGDDACTCPGLEGELGGQTYRYGASIALIRKSQLVMLSLPKLRIEQLITHLSPIEGCRAVYGDCDQISSRNLAVTATVDVDFMVHVHTSSSGTSAGGCGLGVGIMMLSGDLATRTDRTFMLAFRGGGTIAIME